VGDLHSMHGVVPIGLNQQAGGGGGRASGLKDPTDRYTPDHRICDMGAGHLLLALPHSWDWQWVLWAKGTPTADRQAMCIALIVICLVPNSSSRPNTMLFRT
jgi:hypothetical protein